MNRASEIFFEHFGLKPGAKAVDVHAVAEAFSSVPWENLTKFLLVASGDIHLRMPDEVMESHVSLGTGGTCYSLTETLGRIMSACGLAARPLTGHMRHGRNTHCALLVEGEAGRFILDPGYAVPGAVRLREDGSGELSEPGRRMVWKRVEQGWELFTGENGPMQKRYLLESRELSRNEFIGHWHRSFEAAGLNSLHLNRPGPCGGRISAHNDNLRVVAGGGSRNIKLGREYGLLIEQNFGVSPDLAEKAWNELLRRRGGGTDVSS